LLNEATLQQAVQYAIIHFPASQQALLDEKINEATIRSKLADWYPQINFDYNYQRNFQLPTSVFGNSQVKIGSDHTSYTDFSLTQNIF